MTILVALILGIVQGLTEFLPVSSSGHLMLLNSVFKIDGNFLFIEIVLHVATLLAVIIVLRKEIWYLVKNPFSKQMKNLVIATIPTVFIVFIFKFLTNSVFENAKILPVTFMITALFLVLSQFVSDKNLNLDESEMKTFSCLMMGVMQGFAVLPGISRSGSTICTGLIMGENKEKSAKFSFLMSIPIILASLVYEIVFSSCEVLSTQILPIIVSFLSAFIVGILSIKFMLKIVSKSKLYYFAFYLFVLSILSYFIV